MKRLTLDDMTRSGVTTVEALVLYYTQNRNDIETAIREMKISGFEKTACEQHLATVEAKLSELTALLPIPEAGA